MPAHDRSHALDNVVVVLFENRSFDNVLEDLYLFCRTRQSVLFRATALCSAEPSTD